MSAKKAEGSGGRKHPKAPESSEIVDLYKGFPEEERKEASGLLNQATLSVWAATFILCGILVFGLHQIRERLERILAAIEQSAQDDKLVLEGMDELLARADRPAHEAQVEPPPPPPAGRELPQGEEKRAGSDSLARRYKIYYRVKEGEDFGQVAERFGIAEDQLRLWNALKETDAVLPGQVLVINKVAQPDKSVAVAGSPSPARPAKREEPFSPQPRPAGAASEPPPHTRASPEEEAVSAAGLEPPGTQAETAEGPPAAGGEGETAEAAEPAADRPADDNVHIVQKGESLSGIAQMHGVSWLSLAAVNGIKPPGTIYVGQRLRIPTGSEDEDAPAPAGQVLHEVREGENLYRIGRAYGVNWERIARANGITDPATLYAGQVLKIPTKKEGAEP